VSNRSTESKRRCIVPSSRCDAVIVLIALAACSDKTTARRDTAARQAPTAVQQATSIDSTGPALSSIIAGAIGSAESAACDTAAVVLRETLALPVRRADGSFADSFEGKSRVGCRLIASGSFAALGARGDPVGALTRAFEKRHWGTDLRYQADGPDGSDIGMRHRETLCLVLGRWDGGDDSDTTTAPSSSDDDRYDMIIECVHDVASNDDAGVPDSIWSTARAAGLDSLYAIAVRVQYPPYIDGDFDGDGSPDAAVLVEQRSTGKLGVAFVHYRTHRVFVAGAGTAVARGPDDLAWIDEWEVLRKDVAFDTVIRDEPSTPRIGDALWVARGDSASAFLLWTGRGYVWEARPPRQ
jgi:hypothetical protein